MSSTSTTLPLTLYWFGHPKPGFWIFLEELFRPAIPGNPQKSDSENVPD